jgi:hypothetical protein
MTDSKLIPCPDCGRECSKLAQTCPNCGRPLAPVPASPATHPSDALHNQVVNQTAAKIGVCLTLFGLIRVTEGTKKVSVFSDELLAIATVGFLVSGLLAWSAIKEAEAARKIWLGRLGDRIFMVCMGLLGLICVVLALEMLLPGAG